LRRAKLSQLFWRRGRVSERKCARLKGGRYEGAGVDAVMAPKTVADIFAKAPPLQVAKGWVTRKFKTLATRLSARLRRPAVKRSLAAHLFLWDDAYGAAVFQECSMDFLDAGAAGLTKRCVYFMMREGVFRNHVCKQFSVVNQNLWPTFNDCFKALGFVSRKAHGKIQGDQRCRRNQAADQRVIAGIHGVLHCIREHEQENEIEGRELADLSLSRKAQKN
jgi:hypothetical protein